MVIAGDAAARHVRIGILIGSRWIIIIIVIVVVVIVIATVTAPGPITVTQCSARRQHHWKLRKSGSFALCCCSHHPKTDTFATNQLTTTVVVVAVAAATTTEQQNKWTSERANVAILQKNTAGLIRYKWSIYRRQSFASQRPVALELALIRSLDCFSLPAADISMNLYQLKGVADCCARLLSSPTFVLLLPNIEVYFGPERLPWLQLAQKRQV